MNFDPKDLRPEVKKAFIESRESVLKFAEHFLIDPTLGTPFRATYPQRFILDSKKRDIWVCVHRRAGKCVTGDTLVIDPVTLKPTPISQASQFKTTLSFDFTTNKTTWVPCTWVESGMKKCLKIELESGTSVSLSTDHQVFCIKRGWVRASQLQLGDKILAPTTLEIFGDLHPDEDDIYLDVEFSILSNKVSDAVYKYTKESLTIFLREFFLEKGRLLHQHNCLAFMIWSRNLALDLRHLLNRFGVHSRIDEDGNLFITEDMDKSTFLSSIGIDHVITETRSSRKWETVTSIRKLGERPVYDLSVDHEDHNFIGNDLVLHNSYSLTVAALWHAIMKPNQKIVVFAPSSIQINEFFDVLDKWIAKNPFLQALKANEGNHKTPQKRSFTNGSTIQGYLMGLAGSIEGAKKGITADIVFVDEAQLLDEDDWKVINPIMHGDKFRMGKVRSYIAGTTPDNPTNYYYEKIYKLRPADHEERVYIPITENIEYTQEMREQIRLSTPINIWTTEWLLELGEADTAVFRKSDIQACSQGDWEYGTQNIDESRVRFIGVDWDKAQAGTNIAVFQYDPMMKTTEIIYREEVARDKFTYMNACSLILELFEAYRPELVIADQGQGEVQWEYLQMESEKLGSQLAGRLIKKAFNEKIEVPNAQTNELDKKLLKPFLVGMLQKQLQERRFRLPRHDETLANQLLGYKVVKTTLNTTKYTTHNEHIIDCCLFCMYGIWFLYENEFEQAYGGSHNNMKVFNDQAFPIQDYQRDAFWGTIEGPRTIFPGAQIPRTSIDDPFSKPKADQIRDFYLD